MQIKLMSFNTMHCENYITKRIELDRFAETIRGCGADIIGLNEMRGSGEHPGYRAQTEYLAKQLGFDFYFAKAIDVKGNNPYGNGILSRYPIVSAETVMIPDPLVRRYNGYYESRCVLKARISTPAGELTVLVTHFGLNPDEQENAVATALSALEEKHCVLMGDFNVTPENGLLAPIRAKLFDTAELFDKEQLSFPSDAPRIKIDYLFVSHDFSVSSADIPDIVLSDHRPHLATVSI
ncbi:MAG: endonuclease/exonuclease/phosphatase family protein [Clostridia bacterium]|nr:endonuclease/exonuclease/phosphatase family protein [Clostridia bacterium]